MKDTCPPLAGRINPLKIMKKYIFLFITIVYAGGILWFSLRPDYPTGEPLNVWRIAVMNFLHVPAYAGLAFLMGLTYGRWNTEYGIRNTKVLGFNVFPFSVLCSPFSLIFVTATLYGVLNEFVQAGVPGRFFSFLDMISNAVGAGIGIWIVKKGDGHRFLEREHESDD